MSNESLGGMSREVQEETLARAKVVEAKYGRVSLGQMTPEDRAVVIQAGAILAARSLHGSVIDGQRVIVSKLFL